MLPFFPGLYKDELLYSWLARYHLRSCNVSPKVTMTDLYSSPDVLAVPDLPTHLDRLYQRIKHFDVPDVKNWIEKHTLFNYYTVFGKDGVRQQVFNAMTTGNRPGAVHMMTGMMASNISESTYFRYCPYCVEEDIERLGETYWHLAHQLPGILVCLKHDQLLQNSSTLFRGKNKHTYTAATKENCSSKVKSPKYNDKIICCLKEFAANILNLSVGNYNFSCLGIQSSYKYLLQKHGYATINGTVHQRELAEEFRCFYSDELLVALQSQVEATNPACWLKAITRKHRKSFHPIRHLLFINFLKESIDTFYQYADKTYQPFGAGPYPCLNTVADHYKQPVISDVSMTICTDTRKPVGTFACSCGFTYSRRGPDQIPEDLYKIGTIKQFGSIWEDKLHQLINKDKLSHYAAAKQLKADIVTVKKYINGEEKTVTTELINENLLLSEKRVQWLQLKGKYPDLSKTQLRQITPALYTWLYRHNRLWLDENSPDRQASPTVNNRVDWSQRDNELLIEILVTVTNLLSAKRPVYINISRIGKEIGKLALLEQHLDKLPLTAAYLNQVIETREQFQNRRVQWAASKLHEDQEEVAEWKIQRLAGLNSILSHEVQQEIIAQVKQYQLL